MGVLVINWQTYYDAAGKCHALATDLRAADKPVHDAVKGSCKGMAGDTETCAKWGKAYDKAAQSTLQTCTNLADALTNMGYMLYAAGYNWALANNSNPMPDRPTVAAMSECKLSLPTSVGADGDGLGDGGGIPGFYDALVKEIQSLFGSSLPNGNKDTLATAASTWKTFAEHATITSAAGRIAEISNLFADIQDKSGGLDAMLGHLGTLNTGATQLTAATTNLAAPVASYSEATGEVRDKFKTAVDNALIAAGATVVIGVAAAWITAGLSAAGAAGGVVAIAGTTARTIKATYDISKLIKIIGLASAAAGGTAFVVTAFDGVAPDEMLGHAAKLGAIIAMKVYVDSDDAVPAETDRPTKVPNTGTGKEKASDAPSWAKGKPPYVGESGNAYARRLMDEHYGPGNWQGTGPGTEFSKIKKYGDRSWKNPN
ncbi:hypothetical protein ACFVMC_32385 [Nocardia sp. NPDC127579]|uniref:hypothetical protein n=1 Tax=Nocardia sp. NPDC127579 TaxID=3345402 RepID=UPI0036362155